jgi:hypothetical protein
MATLPPVIRNELYREFEFTAEYNGKDSLLSPWQGRVFINLPPPFEKGVCSLLVSRMLASNNELTVLLLPSDTSTEWFHKAYRNPNCSVRFFESRIKWEGDSNRFKSRVPSLLIIKRNPNEVLR